MDVAVSLGGAAGPWDLSAPVAGERKVFDQLIDPAGAWWAASFPGATYAQIIDDANNLFGVFRMTASALEMVGVVSAQDGLTRTLLTYATPIPVLKLPLAAGDQWTADSLVSGQASGVLFAAQEHYAFTVTARGTTKVPAGSFDSLRLRMDYTQTYGLLVTTRITWLHLAECYGAIARVRSTDGETSPDFTRAAEYRRLAAP
jgi:hypothetical protein